VSKSGHGLKNNRGKVRVLQCQKGREKQQVAQKCFLFSSQLKTKQK